MEEKSMIDLAYEFDKEFIDKKAFSLTDTGLHHRLVTYWDSKDLFNKQNDGFKWRKFNFEQLIWIRLIAKLRHLNIGVETIKDIKNELFKVVSYEDVVVHQNADDQIDAILEGSPDKDTLKPAMKKVKNEEIERDKLTVFQLFLKSIYSEKVNISIIIALAEGKTKELERADSTVWMSTWIPEKLEDLSKTKDYFAIFSKTFISISLNELITDAIININPIKLPVNLTFLSSDERRIIHEMRTGDYKSITIRFNEECKPTILELSQVKEIKMESRIYEILHKGAYEDIEIKTQNGKVYYSKSTRKIKLNE